MNSMKFVFILLSVVVSQNAFSKDSKEYLDRRKQVVDEYLKRSEQDSPYWLRDFKKEDSFKTKSLEFQKTINSYKETANSPLCLAIFFNSNGMQNASLYCLKSLSRGNGYTNIADCNIFEVNLGTGKANRNNKTLGIGCNAQAADILLGNLGMMMEIDFMEKPPSGDLGIYIYRDNFKAIKKWAARYQVKPKNKKK